MRKAMLAAAAAALGAGAVVLPAVAGSETSPQIEARNSTGPYAEQLHSWSPSSVSVGEGGSVTLLNPTAVPHGVRWVGGPATPACGAGVPVGTTAAASGTEWSGSCTFAQPGTYTFYCTVHGAAMSGTITVAAPGEPPSSTTTPTAPAAPGDPSLGGGAGSGTGSAGSAPGPGASTGASPFAGGASALRLSSAQRGSSVHGSVSVSPAGAQGSLEVELLAKAASLARGHGNESRIGRLERSVADAGTVRFAVGLNARGRRALARKGRLALTVEVTLTPRGGQAAKLQRGVVLRPRKH